MFPEKRSILSGTKAEEVLLSSFKTWPDIWWIHAEAWEKW